jgi:hypothetical protein
MILLRLTFQIKIIGRDDIHAPFAVSSPNCSLGLLVCYTRRLLSTNISDLRVE